MPIPYAVGEHLAYMLAHLHAPVVLAAFEPLTGIHLNVDGLCLFTDWGRGFMIERECAGLRSLIGLVLFASYYAATERHCIKGFLLMGVTAVVLAVAMNFLRVLISCIYKVAGESYWSTKEGHELLGLIMAIIGIILIQALARDLYVDDSRGKVASRTKLTPVTTKGD